MKKKLLLLFCLLLLTANVQAQSTLSAPKLSWPPYFVPSSSHVYGFGVDVFNRCVNTGATKYQLIDTSLNRSMLQLKEGILDLWVMSKRPGREDWLYYGKEPLFYDSYAMFAAAHFKGDVQKIADLASYRVGTMLGLTVSQEFQDFIATRAEGKKPVQAINELALLRRLQLGHIDVAVTGRMPFLSAAHQLGLSQDVKILGAPIRRKPYYLVVSKKSKRISDPKAFIADFDRCLSSLKQDPAFKALYPGFVE